MIITDESHLDHDITPDQLAWIREEFGSRTGFFIATVALPEELGTVPCALYGPIMGDPPVEQWECFAFRRGDRPWPSRCVIAPSRPNRNVTVIAGPHGTNDCVLYTAFGGPLAPKEPGDPSLTTPEAIEESNTFWAVHALARR